MAKLYRTMLNIFLFISKLPQSLKLFIAVSLRELNSIKKVEAGTHRGVVRVGAEGMGE